MGRGESRRWLVFAALLVTVGIGLSVITSTALAHASADRDRRAFESSTGEIASTYQLAVQRIADLTVAAAAEISAGHESTTAEWSTWVRNLRIFSRYPEVSGLGLMVLVTPDGLDTYAREVEADRGGSFELTPPGTRPFYCFLRLTQSRQDVPVPIGFDLCTVGTKDRLLATRDRGVVSYEGVAMPGSGALIGVQTGVYRGGEVPATVDARRAAFMGWMGLLADPEVILRRSLVGHPGISVRASYRSSLSHAAFTSGRRPAHAATASRSFGDGWTVTAWRKPIRGGVLAHPTALILLLSGVAMTLLTGAVLVLLQTGRARAERLVGIRTEQLQHQALHDPLTGLANRALLQDRIEHLLARGRRDGHRGAALYLDLDGFKRVNDTYGHEAGDQLLQAVAARLEVTVRDADAIGRLGGDEFVVLLDGPAIDDVAAQVSERILTALRDPFLLPAVDEPVQVSTSIGVAVTAEGTTAATLLRDADLALYRSKATGRDRWFRFGIELVL